jgi:hypothetical protein
MTGNLPKAREGAPPRVGPTAVRAAIAIALLVVFLGGWRCGASGRPELDRALQAAELRNDLLEARASVLAARVNLSDGDLYEMNLHLRDARRFVHRALARAGAGGLDGERQRLEFASFGAEIDEAQRLAAVLDRSR